jgi:hypothetical protein
MSEKSTTELDWGEIGEKRWRELTEASGASDLQMRFAVARFAGASATAAARIAGYGGNSTQIRAAGYSALRSTGVQRLLELASLSAPSDAGLTDREVEAKLAKLVRSPDSNIALKAIQIRDGRMEAKRELAASSDREPTWNEHAAEILAAAGDMGVGLVGMSALAYGIDISYSPFKEIAPHLKRDWPDIWGKLISQIGRHNPDTQTQWLAYGDAPLADLSKFATSAAKPVKGNGAASVEREASGHAAV